MLSNREIFDKVVERLYDGTGRALNTNGDCSYLTDKGLKCAVGIFIPDGHPAQITSETPFGLQARFSDLDFINDASVYLLEKLQIVHDETENWSGKDFINQKILDEIEKNPIYEI